MKNKAGRLLILFVFTISSCGTLDPSLFQKKPDASIEKIDIQAISFHDIDLLFNIAIDNPYPLSIRLAEVKLRFLVEKAQLFETKTQKGLKIKASGREVSPFVVNLKYADIEKIVKNFGDRDYLNCQVEGEIVLSLPRTGIPGIPETWPFPYKKMLKIPAIKPVVSVKNFKVDMPSLADVTDSLLKSGKKEVTADKALIMFKDLIGGKEGGGPVKPDDLDVKLTVSFDVELENKTRSRINFNSLDYDFYVNSEGLVKGYTKDVRNVGNKSVVSIKNQISSRSLSKSLIMVFKDRKGEFNLKGTTAVKLPDAIKKEPLKLVIDEKGGFKY